MNEWMNEWMNECKLGNTCKPIKGFNLLAHTKNALALAEIELVSRPIPDFASLKVGSPTTDWNFLTKHCIIWLRKKCQQTTILL